MAYVNMVKPDLARRYVVAGLWTNKTFFELIEERVKEHPEREVFADFEAAHQLWRAQGRDPALRRAVSPHRHQARRRGHRPVAEPHRVCRRFFCP